MNSNLDVEPRKKKSCVDKMVGNADPNKVELFDKPTGIASDSQGRIIFASTQRSTIFVVDQAQKKVMRIQGDRGIVLQTPLGVVVDSHDNLFVSDPFQHMIFKFDRDGHMNASMGVNEVVDNPHLMALDGG